MASSDQIHTQSAVFLVNVAPLLFEYEGVWAQIGSHVLETRKFSCPFRE